MVACKDRNKRDANTDHSNEYERKRCHSFQRETRWEEFRMEQRYAPKKSTTPRGAIPSPANVMMLKTAHRPATDLKRRNAIPSGAISGTYSNYKSAEQRSWISAAPLSVHPVGAPSSVASQIPDVPAMCDRYPRRPVALGCSEATQSILVAKPWSMRNASRTEHPVGGALNPARSSIQDMGVDLRGAHVAVAEQLLNRMSWRSSSKCVANEWRNVWQLAGLAIPARRTASLTARCSTDSCR
jgi:hypothetical protein